VSVWNHAICAECWFERNPGRRPVRLVDPEVEVCCYCREKRAAGIYVRGEPAATPCLGKTGIHGGTGNRVSEPAPGE
jgi:hypothetical protein